MSKPAIAIFAVAAIAVGGYAAVWFQKAEKFKDNFVKSVTDVNAKVKPMLKSGEFLRYESVETSGFPMAMKLSVSKPVMQIPVSAILRTAPKDVVKGEVLPEFDWVEEVNLGDSVSLASDVMGSKFSLVVNGDFAWKTTVGGQTRHAMNVTSTTPFICDLKTKPSGFLVSYPRFKDAETFFEAFEAIDCASNGSTLKDASTGTTFANTDKHRLGLRNVVSNGSRSAGLKYEIVNSEYSKAGDVILENYVNIFAQALNQKPQRIPYSLSEFGKNNLNIDLNYEGPDNTAALENPTKKVSIGVNALDVNSSVFNTNNSLHFTIEPQGDNRRIILKTNSRTNVSERYDQILSDNIKTTLHDLASTEGKSGKDLDIANSIQKFGSIDALVDAALPKLHAQGDMIMVIDVDASGKKGMETSEGQVKVNAFDIFTSLYGIKMKGGFSAIPNKTPVSNADITCLNCDAMIDDMVNYAIRFATYLNTVAPETKAPVPSRELANGVKTFVRSIALNGSDMSAKDIIINGSMNESGEFTVSGKSMMDTMQSYMTNIAPLLPQQPTPQIPSEQMPPEFQQQLQQPSE